MVISEFLPSDSFALFGVEIGVVFTAPRNFNPVLCEMSEKFALVACQKYSFRNDLP